MRVFDIDKHTFFQSINKYWYGSTYDQCNSTIESVFVSYHTKVVKYKPEFPYSNFKKPATDSEYVINKANIYDGVDVVGKLLNFS